MNKAQAVKVVNTLEVFTALILLADFGSPDPADLQFTANLVEHKLNLMILLFTFREQQAMNVSEVIIMIKTAVQTLSKMFPGTPIGDLQMVLGEEVKETVLGLFGPKIEELLRVEKYQQKNILGVKSKKSDELKVNDLNNDRAAL